MDGISLAHLGAFIGAMSVVASLLYLGYQVRQNTRSLRTENYARVLDRVSTMQARLSSDPVYSELVARGTADIYRLTVVERLQFSWTFYEMFGALEFMFHQVEAGALPEEVWKRWSDTLAWWISLPGVRAWWVSIPAPFSASFTRYMDAQLQAGPPDPAASKRWSAFLSNKPSASTDTPCAPTAKMGG